jgi:NADPH:quinone reductase-like Zn-dependent oxidoreductase
VAGFMATALRKAEKKKRDQYFIKELIETEKLNPVMDRRYSMREIVEAHKYVETGHKRGDVVITIP